MTIGAQSAAVDFSGLAPFFVGLYQVNARVPDGVAAGGKSHRDRSTVGTVFLLPHPENP